MEIVKIPIADVSSKAYIEWQCGGHKKGISLNRLAEVCGCFSHLQESWSCHHPDNGDQMCVNHACPIAFTMYPKGCTEEEELAYDARYGDEIEMELSTEGKFGDGGTINRFWWREQRYADRVVEQKLALAT